MKTDILEVPGASLYYELRGSGPVLLLVCGGVYDAAGYAGLADQLADRYTVVTYDRRGNSRSPLVDRDLRRPKVQAPGISAGPPEPQKIEVHGDDAHRVLAAVGVTGGERADVFGNSSGAIIGLELAARHPEQVRTVVAHEPPLFELLDDREHWRTMVRDMEAAFRADGAGAAGEVLATRLMMGSGAQDEGRVPGGGSPGEPDPETLEMLARFEKNMEFFLGYEVPPFAGYVPDFAALQAVSFAPTEGPGARKASASPVRVVPAVGERSVGEPPYRAAFAVAERLGTTPAVFPGDHGGFGAVPEAFGGRLHDVLKGETK
jgi:pimeloyl-ACP methyl ester carboxylesterase